MVEENGVNVTVCVFPYSSGDESGKRIATGVGTVILFCCILYSWYVWNRVTLVLKAAADYAYSLLLSFSSPLLSCALTLSLTYSHSLSHTHTNTHSHTQTRSVFIFWESFVFSRD